jgi:Rps23 Pro-64 3,4-dihydroxylase Tpa1-like proline 4-hydroxylase
MKSIYSENDIGIIEDVFPSFICPQIIQQIEYLQENNILRSRKELENAPECMKEDFSLCMHRRDMDNKLGFLFDENNNEVRFSSVIDMIHKAFRLYSDTALYEDIAALNLWIPQIKLQKTMPGGGYHIWHHEKGYGFNVARYVVFMVYLNTLEPESAGETEFIRQELRITPKENSIVFWPATYTHPHRGNPVYGDKPKYVLTGWFFI